jgi:hypothetical protein
MNRITPKLNRASAVDFADFDIDQSASFMRTASLNWPLLMGNQVKRINTIQFWFQRQCYCE